MDSDRFERLTERQKACLRLVLTGRSSKRIAEVLGISPGTIDQHLKAACQILGQNDRGVAARLFAAWDEGLPQNLDTQPPALVDPPVVRPSIFTEEEVGVGDEHAPTLEVRERRATYDTGHTSQQRTILSLLFPGIGRPPNDLNVRARMTVIATQVVILALSVAALFGAALAASRYLTWLNAHGG